MKRNYADEKTIEEVVKGFETGTIPEEEWHHAEHLIVALYYSRRHDSETALDRMRTGIFGLLKAYHVDTSKETPYHETLTVFWMTTVRQFAAERAGRPVGEIASELVETFDKDHPLSFYTREVLFSDEARSRYVPPDIGNSNQPAPVSKKLPDS